MSATIKVFQVGAKRFTHFMNSMNDSVQLRDEGNETLLTYGPDARVSDQRGHWGSFLIEFVNDQPRWVYYERPNDQRIVLGPDLRSAEVTISKRYLDRFGAVDTEASARGQQQAIAPPLEEYAPVTHNDRGVRYDSQELGCRHAVALF